MIAPEGLEHPAPTALRPSQSVIAPAKRDDPPYPGLRPFRANESHLFFGRDECVDAMVARLAATRFLAVLGNSGVGKSSLVRTGLFPALRMGWLPRAGSTWRIIDCHPGTDPFGNLARELIATETLKANEPEKAAAQLRQSLVQGGPRALIEWCRGGHLASGVNLLLLIDQFEELFLDYQDYARRRTAEAFVALLLESRRPIEVKEPQLAELPIFVTITMRSENLGACSLIEGLAEAINEGTYLTPRMSRQQCREAIVGPACICRVDIEDRLVVRILNDLAEFAPWQEAGAANPLDEQARRADQLPLMQHALNQMWQRARVARQPDEKTVLRAEKYRGLEKELDDHAEAVLRDLQKRGLKPVAETVFRAITVGTTVADARRRPTRYDKLVEICGGETVREAVGDVISAFAAEGSNFLTCDPPQSLTSNPPRIADDPEINISHESLIRQWRTLAGWLDKEAKAAREWQRLGEDAKRYFAPEPGATARLLGARELLGKLKLLREIPTPAWARERYRINYDEVKKYLTRSRVAAGGKVLLASVLVVVVAGALLYSWDSAKLRMLNAELQNERDYTIKLAEQIVDAPSNLLATSLNARKRIAAPSVTQAKPDQGSALNVVLSNKQLLDSFNGLFDRMAVAEPTNVEYARYHMETLILLSFVDLDAMQANQHRQQGHDILAQIRNREVEYETIEAVESWFYQLGLTLNDAGQYDDAVSALDQAQAMLVNFIARPHARGDDVAEARRAQALVFAKICEVDNADKRADDAIAACQNSVKAAEINPQANWDLIADGHRMLSDIYSRQAESADDRPKKKELRGKAIDELRLAIHAANNDFELVFDQAIQTQGNPESWGKVLESIFEWGSADAGTRVAGWMMEADPAFALKRSSWIADRLDGLATLYGQALTATETAVNQGDTAVGDERAAYLGDERASYLIRFIYREALALSGPIDAKALEIRQRIGQLNGQAASDLRDRESGLLNYDHGLARRQLARAMRDIGYLEGSAPQPGEPPRWPASAKKVFISCAEDAMVGLADANDADSLNQQATGMCYYGLGWLEDQRADQCQAAATDAKNACKIGFYESSRDGYRRAKDYLKLAYEHAPTNAASDIAHYLIVSLARTARAVNYIGELKNPSDGEAWKKALTEAAPYSERAVQVAEAAYAACKSAPDANCDQARNDLALRSGIHSWYVLLLNDAKAALKYATEAITVNGEDPHKPTDEDQLTIAINLAHASLFNGDLQGAKAIYLAVKDIKFPGTCGLSLIEKDYTSGLCLIEKDYADLQKLHVFTQGMCDISQALGDNKFQTETCTKR